jgi:hypothetical protein
MNVKSDSSSRILAISLVLVLLGIAFPCGAYAIGENSSINVQGASADVGSAHAVSDPATQEATPQDDVLSVQPEADPAADLVYDIESGDYGYGAYVTQYTGTDTHVVIPAQLGGVDVVSVDIGGSSFTSIDVSAAVNLLALHCSSDQLTSLDVSKNLALTILDCVGNPLTYLNAGNNPALETLFCDRTQLASLDISGDIALNELSCVSCGFTSIDVTHNPALTEIFCDKNVLTSLDLSKNPLLDGLYCSENPLVSLDLSKNPVLTDLSCASDLLTSLDVTHNPALKLLFCDKNSIAFLDISHNAALTRLRCSSNLPTSLDVSANTHLYSLVCDHNCIEDTSSLVAWLGVQGHKGQVDPQKPNVASAVIGSVPDQIYTGEFITPEPAVVFEGNNLVKDVDYKLSYSNNKAAGTATITVSGMGTYGGTTTKTFTIDPADISSGVIAPIPDQSYTGTSISPTVSVALKSIDLVEGVDYEVSYADNTAAGVAAVVISGKGNYAGSISAAFNIIGAGQDASGSDTGATSAAALSTLPASAASASIIPATGDFWFLPLVVCIAALLAGAICLVVFLKRKRYR